MASAHKYLGVPGVSARFSTDPFFWNWAMWLIARLLPPARLRDRAFVKALAKLSDPFVRAVDGIVGEGVAMKVEVDFDGGKSAAGIYYHRKLSDAMGYSLAAFAQALLTGGTQPGVWYPEQAEAITLRRQFLQTASTGATRFVLNKPAWQLESEVKQVIGMVYW